MRDLVAIACLFFCVGCGPIDPPQPTDDDGNPIQRPGPFDTWLEVASVTPGGPTVSTRPIVRFQFETWIDDDALVDYAVVTLRSAGLTARGRVRWEMTTRTLVFEPFGELVEGLRYTPQLDGDLLESVTGAPFRQTELDGWVVDASVEPDEDEPATAPTWEAIDTLFEQKCRSCHADPQWGLNPLTRASLVGTRSEQDDRFLVVPFDAADSYLMHKILPEYPVRQFTVQPPPWSDAEPLTRAERLTIELWIANGAR
jgi:hypothetical protein